MSRLLIFTLFLIVLAGCVATNPMIELKSSSNGAEIALELTKVETRDKGFEIHLEFTEWSHHKGIIQEIELLSLDGTVSYTLVEYFGTPNGVYGDTLYDRHRTTNANYQIRRMRLYPATVEGIHLTSTRFGHLPQNRDGSMVTSIHPNFNKEYQDNYPTTGRVVDDDRDNSIFWGIDYFYQHLKVLLPDGSITEIGKKITATREADDDEKQEWPTNQPQGIRQEPARIGETKAKTKAETQ